MAGCGSVPSPGAVTSPVDGSVSLSYDAAILKANGPSIGLMCTETMHTWSPTPGILTGLALMAVVTRKANPYLGSCREAHNKSSPMRSDLSQSLKNTSTTLPDHLLYIHSLTLDIFVSGRAR